LLAGNYRVGWKLYEWRFRKKDFIVVERNLSQPRWDGGNESGSTILLYAEQGLGDTVHFIRYVPLVAERGLRVIVECQKALVTLMKSVPGVFEVIEKGKEVPAFDTWCPFLTLPLLFGTTLESIPENIPYLRVQTEKKEKWRRQIMCDPPGFRVGLVWSGNPAYRHDRIRSCSIELLEPLGKLERLVVYSLQKGAVVQHVEHRSCGLKLINYMEEMNDFSDTAALIECLDLVISVDTAVLHVAGALGKDVWALLPYVPDWRWMLNRKDSPWYPTMRLFRQPNF
jgi:Glycosyltransferase family 9 (heptosyltransferase)